MRQHLVIPMLELSVRRRVSVPQVVEGVHFWSASKHTRKKKVIHEMRLSEISILLSSLDNSPFLWRCSGADADEEAGDESAQDTETRHSNSANVSVSERLREGRSDPMTSEKARERLRFCSSVVSQ